jgi:putative ABC transport system permease protein
MGTYKLALKMLKTDLKQTVLYLLFIIFSVATLFIGYAMMNDNNYSPLKGSASQLGQVLLFGLTILLLFMVFFANSYFITGKTKEFAIAELYGICSTKLMGLLSFQTFLLGLIGSVFGILLGMLSLPIVSSVMYRLLGAQQNIYSTTSDSILITFIIVMLIMCPYIIGGDYGYLFHREIKDLIYGQRQLYTPHAKKITIPEIENIKKLFPFLENSKPKKPHKTKSITPQNILSILLYFLPISVLFLDSKNFYALMVFYLLFSVIGIHKILTTYLPDKILSLKKNVFAGDEIKLISLSNLHYSLRKMNFLIVALAISTVSLVFIIGSYGEFYQVKVMGIFVYICAIVSLGISILYKFMIESSYRKHIFMQLQLLGYHTKQIKKIIKQELILLYGVAIVIPLVHVVVYLAEFINLGIITLQLSLILLSIFIIIFVLMLPISYFFYKKSVL